MLSIVRAVRGRPLRGKSATDPETLNLSQSRRRNLSLGGTSAPAIHQ